MIEFVSNVGVFLDTKLPLIDLRSKKGFKSTETPFSNSTHARAHTCFV